VIFINSSIFDLSFSKGSFQIALFAYIVHLGISQCQVSGTCCPIFACCSWILFNFLPELGPHVGDRCGQRTIGEVGGSHGL